MFVREVLRTQSRSQNDSDVTFSPSRCQSLSKKAQFESWSFYGSLQCSSARLSASTKAAVRFLVVIAPAGGQSMGGK